MGARRQTCAQTFTRAHRHIQNQTHDNIHTHGTYMHIPRMGHRRRTISARSIARLGDPTWKCFRFLYGGSSWPSRVLLLSASSHSMSFSFFPLSGHGFFSCLFQVILCISPCFLLVVTFSSFICLCPVASSFHSCRAVPRKNRDVGLSGTRYCVRKV